MQSILWNIIAGDVQLDRLSQKEFRRKIGPLEKHLKPFPAGTVHLQILLEKKPRQPLPTVMLTLRSSADILVSKKSAPDLIKALDDALEDLVGKLESQKKDREQDGESRKTDETRRQKPAPETAGFAAEPQPEDAGPQTLSDVIREFFQQHYNRLLNHARRHIQDDEMTGDLPLGAVDARDIVDEVARQAEDNPGRKPEKMSWLVWLFHLLHEELRRQRRFLKQEATEDIPTEKRFTPPELRPKALQPREKMVQTAIEPQVIRVEDVVSDPGTLPPDRFLADRELSEELQRVIQSWPRPERKLFELSYCQCLTPKEIAHITGQPLKKVKDILATLQDRLREELLGRRLPHRHDYEREFKHHCAGG